MWVPAKMQQQMVDNLVREEALRTAGNNGKGYGNKIVPTFDGLGSAPLREGSAKASTGMTVKPWASNQVVPLPPILSLAAIENPSGAPEQQLSRQPQTDLLTERLHDSNGRRQREDVCQKSNARDSDGKGQQNAAIARDAALSVNGLQPRELPLAASIDEGGSPFGLESNRPAVKLASVGVQDEGGDVPSASSRSTESREASHVWKPILDDPAINCNLSLSRDFYSRDSKAKSSAQMNVNKSITFQLGVKEGGPPRASMELGAPRASQDQRRVRRGSWTETELAGRGASRAASSMVLIRPLQPLPEKDQPPAPPPSDPLEGYSLNIFSETNPVRTFLSKVRVS